MAAAAGKKSTTSLSLFREAFGLEVEEGLSPLWPHSTGQKEYRWENGIMNKGKLGCNRFEKFRQEDLQEQ